MKKIYILDNNKISIQNILGQNTDWDIIENNKYYKIYYRKHNKKKEIFLISTNKKHKILKKILKNLIENVLEEEDISILKI